MKNNSYLLLLIGVASFILFTIFIYSSYEYSNPKKPSPPSATKPTKAVVSNPLDDEIILDNPMAGDVITPPQQISGKARGSWFFEANFPIVLTDWDGNIIAESFATAEGEWMTEDFVPFTATLEFIRPSYGDNGNLILKKANPSGLPENDKALEIAVFFK